MPNVTITQLPQALPLDGTESVPIVQGGQTRQTTTGAIANAPILNQTFLTIVSEPTLPNSRYLSTGTGLGLTDGGAQSFYRLTLNGTSGSLETASDGVVVKSSGLIVSRTIVSGSDGVSITNGNGAAGNPAVGLSGTVLSLAQLSSTGIVSVNGSSVNARVLTGTTNEIDITSGNGTNNPTFRIADNAVLPGTGGIRVPIGTTAQRPAGTDGLLRYNSETNGFEVYENGSWSNLPTGAVTLINTGTGLTGGPITTTGTISIANTGVTAASYGAQSKTLQITVNAQGQLTAASQVDILIANTQVTGLGTMSTQNANNVAITGGSINGTTIGASSATTGTFTTVSATTVDTTNLQVSNLKAKDGTAAATIADSTGNITISTLLNVDNLRLDGNTLSATNTNGDLNLTANGTGTSWLNVNWGVNNLGNLIPKTDATYDIGDATYKPRDVYLTRDLTVGRNISVTGNIGSPTYIQFNTTQNPLPTDATGRLYYNSDDQFQTLAYQMNGDVVHKIGEELYYRIKCQGSITKGQVVSFAGTIGASGGLIGKAATGLTNDQSYYILGIAAESGVNNDWIFVTTFGEVKNLNTTGGAEAWVQGQELYYDPTVTGGLTKTKPAVPNAIALVAAVVNVGTSNGILFVRPTYGSVLGGTDGNVSFGTLSDGDLIQYYGTGQYWRNVAPSTVTVGTATNAVNTGITDDTTTNADMYPTWVTANTGNLPQKVTSTKLKFNPSTGILTATGGISGGTF